MSTEKIAQSPSLVIINQEAVVKTVCHFLASSNTILEFLDFQQHETGLLAGGDSSLEKQVKAAQELVQALLNAFLLHKRAENYPGKELGMLYNEDVKVYGGFVFHKNELAVYSDIPDPAGDNFDLRKLARYWHPEHIYHPLRRVPGTPWHKFFGNLHPLSIMNPTLFRERKPLPEFTVILPQNITWLIPELFSDYEENRLLFERVSCSQPHRATSR